MRVKKSDLKIMLQRVCWSRMYIFLHGIRGLGRAGKLLDSWIIQSLEKRSTLNRVSGLSVCFSSGISMKFRKPRRGNRLKRLLRITDRQAKKNKLMEVVLGLHVKLQSRRFFIGA